MVKNKVVVHFKDDTLVKGMTSDFAPTQERFHVTVQGGDIKAVLIKDLKGLFFVKDFDGNKDYRASYLDDGTIRGHKVKVNFSDGEEVIGFARIYTPDWPGFFMVPADKDSNNERIFVVTSACRQVGFMI
ncbi:MAG: hypothetical protein COX17_00320 [Deltaproteobacteria bacterium CG23_combo_of_CG06-09_8_20_14_all_60_8]|nr:MAG: hypothetical protein COX17_00320 [Deltaproteobacteria bacterium CG23_combo_of_CG06-09_8_20_14_all_60_8]